MGVHLAAHTSHAFSQISNSFLECRCSALESVLPPQRRTQTNRGSSSAQVAAQLHALLQEKAKLASENERLLRENCGLQV